jgi:hypothetical protein
MTHFIYTTTNFVIVSLMQYLKDGSMCCYDMQFLDTVPLKKNEMFTEHIFLAQPSYSWILCHILCDGFRLWS